MMFSSEDQEIKLYSYDAVHKNFISSFVYFWANGTGFAANSTNIAPPEVELGNLAVFDENTKTWRVVEDHHGKIVYSTEDKAEHKINYFGPIKTGFTELKPGVFETWNGTSWIDERTPEEREAYRLAQFPALKRRQFMRVMVMNGFDLDFIESEINKIQDTQTRQLALIDWKDATEFWRTDETLLMIAGMLGMTTEKIDEMWQQALTL